MHHRRNNAYSAYQSYKHQRIALERQTKYEQEYLQRLQQQIANIVLSYMNEEKIGFNELVRRLDMSPSKVSSIRKKEANLTLSSLAKIFALINKAPEINVTEVTDP